jgi:hypothetical protein
MRSRYLFTILVVAGVIWTLGWLRSRGISQQDSTGSLAESAKPPARAPSAENDSTKAVIAPNSQSGKPGSTSAATVPTAPTPAKSAAERASESERVSKVFAKHSNGSPWTLESNDAGQIVRMNGSGLRAMAPGAEANAFLKDLTQELGFEQPARFERSTKRSTRFEMVDYAETLQFADGTSIPVFNGWLRLKGTQDDGALMAINQLKPLSADIKSDITLTDDNALGIAKSQFTNASADAIFRVVKPDVIFADRQPQERATQIEVSGPLPHWRILVGHFTKSIVHAEVSSRE